MLSIDIFSFGAIYNYVSYDPVTGLAGHNSMKSWLYWFLGSNSANVVIFLFAIIIWKNHSENIIDEVDDASLTPTD